MSDISPAQRTEAESLSLSDTALLEDALQGAISAHAAGLLAAPFGVNEVALRRARRRAIRADAAQSLRESTDNEDGVA
jgi:hypothetical protein